jgi:hypothetical protein
VDAEIASHALIGVAEHLGRILVEEPDRFDAERLVATIAALLAGFRR